MSRTKRLTVVSLVVALSVLLALGLWRQTLDFRTGWLLVLGIILGGLYAATPGGYGNFIASIKRARFGVGPLNIGLDPKLTDDDDPSNISPRGYLPILLIVILLAAVISFLYLR
jgi:hypothetical protein